MDDAHLAELNPPLDVTYSGADMLAANLAAWRYLAGLIAAFALLLWLVPTIFILIDGYTFAEAVGATDWVFLATVLLILIAFIVVMGVVRFWWRRFRGTNEPISFALSLKGIKFRNPSMDGLVFWNAIRSVQIRSERLYLFLNRRSVLILPRRIFASNEQFERFSATARDLWEQDRRS